MKKTKREFSKLSIIALILTLLYLIQIFFPFILYSVSLIEPYIKNNKFLIAYIGNLPFYVNVILLVSTLIISISSIISIKKYNLRGIAISIFCLIITISGILAVLLLAILTSRLS